jgi:hypothetical protein
MKRLVAVTLALAAAAVVASAALAKGPSAAQVEGPGLKAPILFKGFGEPGDPSAFGQLVEQGGFFPSVFGQSPNPMHTSRPSGDLGPRYTVTYTLPGPNGATSTIVQDVYPYATPAPVTYMRPGQPYWDGGRTYGGWFRGDPALHSALVAAGLPASAPGHGSGWSWPATTLTSLGALLLAAALLLLIRRRVRPRPEQRPQII